MTDALQSLIEALRSELQHYGEMLALLDRQQELVIQRSSEDLLQSVADVQAHCALLQETRRRRQHCQRSLATTLLLSNEASFQEISPRLPGEYRPLLEALVQENNELLVRVQQRSRQNHILLSRSLEMMQRLINTLCPGSNGPAYNPAGQLTATVLPSCTLYEAVG